MGLKKITISFADNWSLMTFVKKKTEEKKVFMVRIYIIFWLSKKIWTRHYQMPKHFFSSKQKQKTFFWIDFLLIPLLEKTLSYFILNQEDMVMDDFI